MADTGELTAPEPGLEDGVAVLALEGIEKRFAGVTALAGVSLRLFPGQVHALVGENGAGKSTLIKVMTGFYRPDAGTIALRGHPVHFDSAGASQAAGVQTVYQEVNLVPARSVAENLMLGREPTRFGLVDNKTRDRQAREILAHFGLGGIDVRQPVGALGLGTQQMVAIVRAVSQQAAVVVLDEPTSALAAGEVERLIDVVRRLADQGVAVVYVSHRMEEIYRLCHQVTVLRDGKVVHNGLLASLPREQLVAAMLGHELAAAVARPLTATTEAGDDRPLLLQASGVSTSVGRRVSDVSIDARAGEVVGLAGLLGAGKTELFRALFGADRAAGKVTVDGRQVRSGSPSSAIAAGMAFLPEDRKKEGIIPNLSVRENILAAGLRRVSKGGVVSRRASDQIVRQYMERLNIKASSPSQPVKELSGGNQQKVLLARWLCLNPKLLLLDDPTRGIDVGAKAEVRSLIDDLARDGLGVLMTSSEIEEVIDTSERVVLMRDGSMVGQVVGADVSAEEIIARLAGAPESALDDRDHADGATGGAGGGDASARPQPPAPGQGTRS
jgi:monosaccharide-transporting ATPase